MVQRGKTSRYLTVEPSVVGSFAEPEAELIGTGRCRKRDSQSR